MTTPSLSGGVVLVTGATSGIGFHTASALGRSGATVYITGRDPQRGAAAEQALRTACGHDRVHFVQSDASTVGGNQALGRHLLRSVERLDVLVNNVGGAYNDRQLTADGYEASLATNFIGPFALTETLLPLLKHNGGARIVNVASEAYRMWTGDAFSDVHSTERYLGSAAYARAKLLNVLWTLALARRLDGGGAVANAADPGTAWTPMTQGIEARSMPLWLRALWPLVRARQKSGSAERAAQSSIFAATIGRPSLNGTYINPQCRPVPLRTKFGGETFQEQSWELGARLVSEARTAVARED